MKSALIGAVQARRDEPVFLKMGIAGINVQKAAAGGFNDWPRCSTAL